MFNEYVLYKKLKENLTGDELMKLAYEIIFWQEVQRDDAELEQLLLDLHVAFIKYNKAKEQICKIPTQ